MDSTSTRASISSQVLFCSKFLVIWATISRHISRQGQLYKGNQPLSPVLLSALANEGTYSQTHTQLHHTLISVWGKGRKSRECVFKCRSWKLKFFYPSATAAVVCSVPNILVRLIKSWATAVAAAASCVDKKAEINLDYLLWLFWQCCCCLPALLQFHHTWKCIYLSFGYLAMNERASTVGQLHRNKLEETP